MKRKLIRQGKSALTVTLPAKWAEENEVKAGDEIEVDIEENKLIFSVKKEPEIKKIEVDVTEYDRSSFLKLLLALYQIGYDEIRISFNKDEFMDYKINKKVKISEYIDMYTKQRLIGLEVVSQGSNFYLLKDVTTGSEKDFETFLRRTFFLLIEFQEAIIPSLKNKDYTELRKAWNRHDNTNKFINYCLRLLNKTYVKNTIEKNNLFYIIMALDEMVDHTRFCCQDILKLKQNPAPQTISIITDVIAFFRLFYELYYKYDLEKLKKITQFRYEIKDKIAKLKATPYELILVTRFATILEVMQNVLMAKLALNNLSN